MMKQRVLQSISTAGSEKNRSKINTLINVLRRATGIIAKFGNHHPEYDTDLVMAYREDLSSLDLRSNQKVVLFSSEPIKDLLELDIKVDANTVSIAGDLPKMIVELLSYSLDPAKGNFSNLSTDDQTSGKYALPAVNAISLSLIEAIQELFCHYAIYFHNTHPLNAKFSIALTHDIDYWALGITEKIKLGRNLFRSLFSSPHSLRRIAATSRYCLNHSPIDLRRMENLEKKHNVRSSVFFSGFTRQPEDKWALALINPGYSFRNTDIGHLDADHFEIGIHGSTASYDSFERFNEELQQISTKAKVLGGRQHMLSWNSKYTFDIFEMAGLIYDSTMGFNNYNGFRNLCGFTHNPIRPSDSNQYNFVEIPLIYMDSVLTKAGVHDPSLFDAEIHSFTQTAKRLSISGAVCWHDVAFREGSIMESYYSKCIALWLREGAFVGRAIDLATFHNTCKGLSAHTEKDSLWLKHDSPDRWKIYLKKVVGKKIIEEIETDLSRHKSQLLT